MQNYILCCDWGTSSFRLRLVSSDDYSIIAEHHSGDGVAATYKQWETSGADRQHFYGNKIKEAIAQLEKNSGLNLNNLPVIVSGMASSTIGMKEVPYALLPFAVDGSQASVEVIRDFNGVNKPMVLISGVRSDDDVMRGEEAQLVGLFLLTELAHISSDNSIFIFPGTHSKHIDVENGLMQRFRTYMTGEIFNILSEHSILKDSILKTDDFKNERNLTAFRDGVIASANSNLLNTLFTVRTNQLFKKFDQSSNAFYMSGLLIGTELRQLGSIGDRSLVICSGKHLYDHYKVASETLDLSQNSIFIDSDLIDKATIAGQIQIFKSLTSKYE